ncbi:hypothetical protein [Pilimelia columellifera]|uniref:WXG100 family type VII secretion target n=1 Tax=Pilimelia columellifera subsp. columellifera TaxID=706583 RepID=A0ABN3MZ22_9ACTN
MALYGDPDRLDQLADHLLTKADAIRRHADDHLRRGQTAHWVSAAGSAYREQLAADRQLIERSAVHLEQAAAALRGHADEVRERVAFLVRLARHSVAELPLPSPGLLPRGVGR